MKIIFDTETTGLPIRKGFDQYYSPSETKHYENSRLVQLGYVIIDDNNNIIKEYSQIIKPDQFIITNSQFHGITQERALNQGKSIQEVLSQFHSDLRQCNLLISHNNLFDTNIVLSECYRYNLNVIAMSIERIMKFCTMNIGKQKMMTRKVPKLVELFAYLYPGKSWNQIHDALDDTKCCLECYKKIEI
jgi:DNA polymerase III epsilon subunit-like protein